jgi:hypothetical protein
MERRNDGAQKLIRKGANSMMRRRILIFGLAGLFSVFGLALLAVSIGFTAAQAPPLPQPSPVKPCPGDNPLGGRIEVEYVSNPYGKHDCQGTIRTVLRFPLVDNSRPASLWTGFSAPELNYDVSTEGCIDTPGDDCTCHADGGHKSGKVILGTIGPLGFRGNKEGQLVFKPVKPEMYFTIMPDEIHEAFKTPLTCVCVRSGGMKASWLVGFAGGDIRPRGRGNTDQAFVAFVDPTGCNDSVDCMQHAERYAVIPFSGHSVWIDPRPMSTADFPRVEMKWEICCGCGASAELDR